MEKALQYCGKKSLPVSISPAKLKRPVKFVFGEPTWLVDVEADYLIDTNPGMFSVVGVRESEPVKTEEPITEVEEDFYCALCDKHYKEQRWYENHMQKVHGETQE